uniref:Uncharacterized protein n=1 Tax=Rhipicephalus microplus TaxID=6941 RepID=A0A6G5AEY5_RHIMP
MVRISNYHTAGQKKGTFTGMCRVIEVQKHGQAKQYNTGKHESQQGDHYIQCHSIYLCLAAIPLPTNSSSPNNLTNISLPISHFSTRKHSTKQSHMSWFYFAFLRFLAT